MSCRRCGAPLPDAGNGRPRLYCSPACRQRAYRARRAVVAHPGAAAEALAALAAALRDDAELILLLSRGWTAPDDSRDLTVDALVRDAMRLVGRLAELNDLRRDSDG